MCRLWLCVVLCVLPMSCVPLQTIDHTPCPCEPGWICCFDRCVRGEMDCCQVGYTGEDCDLCQAGYHLEADVCVENMVCPTEDPCSGHGACTEQDGYATCHCDLGYIGVECEICDVGYRMLQGRCQTS